MKSFSHTHTFKITRQKINSRKSLTFSLIFLSPPPFFLPLYPLLPFYLRPNVLPTRHGIPISHSSPPAVGLDGTRHFQALLQRLAVMAVAETVAAAAAEAVALKGSHIGGHWRSRGKGVRDTSFLWHISTLARVMSPIFKLGRSRCGSAPSFPLFLARLSRSLFGLFVCLYLLWKKPGCSISWWEGRWRGINSVECLVFYGHISVFFKNKNG